MIIILDLNYLGENGAKNKLDIQSRVSAGENVSKNMKTIGKESLKPTQNIKLESLYTASSKP